MRRVFDEDVPVRKMRAEVKRTKAAAEVIKQKEQAKAAELLAPVMPGVRALFDSDVPEAKMRADVRKSKAAAEAMARAAAAKAARGGQSPAEAPPAVHPGVRALFDSDVPEAKMREEVKSWYDAGMRLREAREAAEWHGAGQVLE